MTGCSGGQLTGDSLVLHATSRCSHLTHIDTSWTDVDSDGVTAFSDNCHRYVLLTYSLN